jgi:hypothetical protein
MIWFPSAFLADNISFQAVDDSSAPVNLTDHGRNATATLFFDKQGRLTDFVAKRWPARTVEAKLFVREPLTVAFRLALRLPFLFVMAASSAIKPTRATTGALDYYVPAYCGLVWAAVGLLLR